MSNQGSSGDMIQSPVQQKLKLPVPKEQSTPREKMDQVTESGQIESGMKNLNTRFADIVDRNSKMEVENKNLKAELEEVEKAKQGELNSIKSVYDCELKEARRLLDSEAEKSVARDCELANLRESNKEMKEKAITLRASEQEARKMAEELQAEMDGLRAEAVTNRRRAQDMENQKAELLMQLNAAKSDVDRLKKDIDAKAVQIAQKDNQIQTQQEDHEMKMRVLQEQLEAAKKDQAAALQRSLAQESTYNSTMASAIDDIRAEHEDNLKGREDQIKAQYARKIADLEAKIERGQAILAEKRDEASKHKALHDQAKQNTERLERDMARTRNRNMALEADLQSQKSMADEKIAELEQEANSWAEKHQKLESDMSTGKDMYATLLKEVETYRSLLEIEETRLNITPSPIRERKERKRPRASSSATNSSSPKKLRTADNSAESATLEVSEIGQNKDQRDNDASCSVM